MVTARLRKAHQWLAFGKPCLTLRCHTSSPLPMLVPLPALPCWPHQAAAASAEAEIISQRSCGNNSCTWPGHGKGQARRWIWVSYFSQGQIKDSSELQEAETHRGQGPAQGHPAPQWQRSSHPKWMWMGRSNGQPLHRAFDPVTALWGTYPRDILTYGWNGDCPASFNIAKFWKLPRWSCSSTRGLIK